MEFKHISNPGRTAGAFSPYRRPPPCSFVPMRRAPDEQTSEFLENSEVSAPGPLSRRVPAAEAQGGVLAAESFFTPWRSWRLCVPICLNLAPGSLPAAEAQGGVPAA